MSTSDGARIMGCYESIACPAFLAACFWSSFQLDGEPASTKAVPPRHAHQPRILGARQTINYRTEITDQTFSRKKRKKTKQGLSTGLIQERSGAGTARPRFDSLAERPWGRAVPTPPKGQYPLSSFVFFPLFMNLTLRPLACSRLWFEDPSLARPSRLEVGAPATWDEPPLVS